MHRPDGGRVVDVPLAGHHLPLEDLCARRFLANGREAGDVPERDHVVQNADAEVDVRRAVRFTTDDAGALDVGAEVLVAAEVEDSAADLREGRVNEGLPMAEALGATGRGLD